LIYIEKGSKMAAAGGGNEVDDIIRDLKKIDGFYSYVILNNDGIVIKYENMTYRTAVHYAHLVLSLYGKASKYIRDLFEHPDNEVESIRMITKDYEMVIAQHGNFTLVATHTKNKPEVKVAVEGEKKEGEAEKKEAP
jgi:dynein light chain roadblock-type